MSDRDPAKVVTIADLPTEWRSLGVQLDDPYPNDMPPPDEDNRMSTTPTTIELAAPGQLRFAQQLAEQYRNRLLHVHGIGWLWWDGARWAVDEGTVRAKNAVIELLLDEWGRAFADHELQREIKKCQTAAGVRGILELAEVLDGLVARLDDLDADPYVLNVANGTLNLQTGVLRPHDPADRITKVCRGAYRPGCRSSSWDAFLARILPDRAVRAYLARFVGVALIGKVLEHEFTIGTGTGANGKGVTYGAILHALGDYAATMPTDVLIASKHTNAGAAKPDIVELRGRRFVVSSETEREVTLASTLMKHLTGGDPLKARALYRDPIEFPASHSLFMVTNFLPKLPGSDPAVWRRVRVIPFDVVIPEPERDPQLGEKLEAAADAILSWALAGLADYWQQGMAPPEAVQQATASYRRKSDAIARFVEDRIMPNPNIHTAVADVWSEWLVWSRDDGADEVSKREFNEELTKRGWRVVQKKINGRNSKVWSGIGLYAPEDEAA